MMFRRNRHSKRQKVMAGVLVATGRREICAKCEKGVETFEKVSYPASDGQSLMYRVTVTCHGETQARDYHASQNRMDGIRRHPRWWFEDA